MLTLDELALWSAQDIEAEIRATMPPDWTFEHTFQSDVGWCAFIRDKDEAVLWQCIGALDPKLSLFGAYGWLRLRDAKPSHPAWVRRSDQMPPIRTGRMTVPGLQEDPAPYEDLDPESLQSVYFGDPSPKRR